MKGMQQLDRNAVTAASGSSTTAAAFKAIGISANDGTTQIQRLYTVADKFASMADGPNKAALAMNLFGRAGAQLIPVLDLGSEKLKEITQAAQDYDVASTAVAESGQEKGEALAESVNVTKLAWQGVVNVLMDALGPALKTTVDGLNELIQWMVQSYNQGGLVADIFAVISVAVEAFSAIVDALAGVFGALWDAVSTVMADIASVVADVLDVKFSSSLKTSEVLVNEFKDAMTVAKDVIVIAIDIIAGAVVQLIDYLQTLAKVAGDALALNWSAVESDWQAGLDKIAADVADTVNKIKTSAAEAGAAIGAALQGKSLPGGSPVELPKAEGGGSFNPDITEHPKQKKAKDDLVQRLQAELDAKKLAWAMEQDAQGTAIQYSLQAEADYWMKILDGTNLSAKDRAQVEEKYLAVHSQIIQQRWAIEEDGYKRDLAAAGNNEQAKLELAEKHLADVATMYGTESKQYAAAQAQIVKIKQEAAAQIRQLDQLRADAADKADLAEIAAAESVAKQRVALGVETKGQLLQQETQFENQRYAIQLAALQRNRQALDPTRDPVKYAQINGQIEALEQQHQAKLTQIDQQAELQRTAIERTGINGMAQTWAQNIAKLVTLQQGFASTIRSLYAGIVDVISTALESIIEKWIEQQLAAFLLKRTAQATDGVASVTSNAAVAASGAYAATAAIPLVGPELAPAAAATAFAGAMSFAPIASAAGGWWDVPGDQIAAIHKNEMVLPSWAAQPLRSIIGGGANSNAPTPANNNGGDFHYHDHSARGLTPDQIIANRSAIAKAMKIAHREGAFAGTSLS